MVSPGPSRAVFPFRGVPKNLSGGSWSPPPPVYKRCELGLGLTLARENPAVAVLGELLRFITKCPTRTGEMAPFVKLILRMHLKRRE